MEHLAPQSVAREILAPLITPKTIGCLEHRHPPLSFPKQCQLSQRLEILGLGVGEVLSFSTEQQIQAAKNSWNKAWPNQYSRSFVRFPAFLQFYLDHPVVRGAGPGLPVADAHRSLLHSGAAISTET